MVEHNVANVVVMGSNPITRSKCRRSQAVKAVDCKSANPGSNPGGDSKSGCSSMVEPQPSKLKMRVRFPSPALYPIKYSSRYSKGQRP